MVFKIITYLHSGNFVEQRQMKMTDLFRCGMPSNSSASIKIGNNIRVECEFDFDYLVKMSQGNKRKHYLYELYLQGANDQFYPVAVYINNNNSPIRRFFL